MRAKYRIYLKKHKTPFLALVNMVIDIRVLSKELGISFSNVWHTSGVLEKQRNARSVGEK